MFIMKKQGNVLTKKYMWYEFIKVQTNVSSFFYLNIHKYYYLFVFVFFCILYFINVKQGKKCICSETYYPLNNCIIFYF